MMNKLFYPALLIMSLFAAACSDNNNEPEPITPFSLDKTYYEVRLERGSTTIHVTNGSGDISLSIEDEKILNAKYEGGLYADGLRGVIYLYGLQKGNTTLTITDNVTGDKQTVEVKVTDLYLAYGIAYSNHPALQAGTVLFLVNNQARDCYLFLIDNMHGQLYDRPLVKGSYEFFVTTNSGTAAPQLYDIPNLRLTYPSDDEGNPTDSDITATPHDFQIEIGGQNASSSSVLQIIQAYLGVDWDELTGKVQTKTPAPDMRMIMTVPDTDYQITGVLSTVSIPEHVLD